MPPRRRIVEPADHRIAPAVAETVRALKLEPEDAGAVRLAENYARALDEAEDRAAALADLGPKLLGVLTALGATPSARSAALKGGASSGPTRLDALRARRQR